MVDLAQLFEVERDNVYEATVHVDSEALADFNTTGAALLPPPGAGKMYLVQQTRLEWSAPTGGVLTENCSLGVFYDVGYISTNSTRVNICEDYDIFIGAGRRSVVSLGTPSFGYIWERSVAENSGLLLACPNTYHLDFDDVIEAEFWYSIAYRIMEVI